MILVGMDNLNCRKGRCYINVSYYMETDQNKEHDFLILLSQKQGVIQ